MKNIDFDDLVGLHACLRDINFKEKSFILGSLKFYVETLEEDVCREEISGFSYEKINESSLLEMSKMISITKISDLHFEGYGFVNSKGIVIFEFGTDAKDEYYPSVIFKNVNCENIEHKEKSKNKSYDIKDIKKAILKLP